MRDTIYDWIKNLGLLLVIISFIIFLYLIVTGNSYSVVVVDHPLAFVDSYMVENPIFDLSVLGIFIGFLIFIFGILTSKSKD